MSIDLNLEPLEATLGAGALIVNDYRITTEPIEGGHRLTVTRGSEVQTMDLLDGAPGAPGAIGPQGPQGEKGEKGDKGDTGSQGPQGEPGPQGIPGEQGPQGEKGETGAQGPQGIQGEQGQQGDPGPAGPQGEKGDKGDTGPVGPQGEPGQDAPQESVLYTPQTLTTEQQAQARVNIGAADVVAVNGLKGDLSDLAPDGAAVGQLFRVAAISEDGKYTMEPVDMLDVQINGESIVQDGVANIPELTSAHYGVAKYISGYGLLNIQGRGLCVDNASNSSIDNRYNYSPITAKNLDYAVKAAMCDGKGAAWTADEQAAARERVGAIGKMRLIATVDVAELSSAIYVAQDADGKSIDLIEIVIIGIAPASTNGDAIDGYVSIGGDGFTGYKGMFGPINLKSTAYDTCWMCHIIANPNAPTYSEIVSAVRSGTSASANKQVSFGNAVRYTNNINKIAIYPNGTIEVGTKIFVLGVDRI